MISTSIYSLSMLSLSLVLFLSVLPAQGEAVDENACAAIHFEFHLTPDHQQDNKYVISVVNLDSAAAHIQQPTRVVLHYQVNHEHVQQVVLYDQADARFQNVATNVMHHFVQLQSRDHIAFFCDYAVATSACHTATFSADIPDDTQGAKSNHNPSSFHSAASSPAPDAALNAKYNQQYYPYNQPPMPSYNHDATYYQHQQQQQQQHQQWISEQQRIQQLQREQQDRQAEHEYQMYIAHVQQQKEREQALKQCRIPFVQAVAPVKDLPHFYNLILESPYLFTGVIGNVDVLLIDHHGDLVKQTRLIRGELRRDVLQMTKRLNMNGINASEGSTVVVQFQYNGHRCTMPPLGLESSSQYNVHNEL